ncbi:type 1 periplasmic binding fold superfamily protein [Salibacteraceae bacterium]|nr:type 1 periplasmic binding fold superfamily protein [Salibacteraceae bacterium]
MNYFKTTFLISIVLISISCKRDPDDPTDPIDVNEEELITTVRLNFENTASSNQFSASWTDKDGDGGDNPTIDSIYLDTNASYQVSIEFLDESSDEVEDITEEVQEEGVEHIVCLESSSSEIQIERTDSDGTYEIGLESKWTISNAANGSLTISLKHQPDVKDGTCNPGETDVEVIFPFAIN